MNKTVIIAAKVKYMGEVFNTKLMVEYKHTGVMFFKDKAKTHYTNNPEIAANYKHCYVEPGYYYMSRLAIPNNGDWWYINNQGDQYEVIKVSKYGKKIHAQLSKPQNP